MMENFKRIYRSLQESGGIESSYDLSVFVEVVDGLLAAFAELKERREDEEFLRGNVFPYFDGEGVGWKVRRWDDRCLIGEGPTLHAAILAARKEK